MATARDSENPATSSARASSDGPLPELTSKEQIIAELHFDDPRSVVADEASAELIEHVAGIFDEIQNIAGDNAHAAQRFERGLRLMGEKPLRDMSRQCEEIIPPIDALRESVDDEGVLSRSLAALESYLDDIDPQRVDFAPSALKNLLASLPGIDTPVARWLAKCQDVDADITARLAELENQRDHLERQGTALRDDQRRMRELGFALKDYIMLAQLLEDNLSRCIGDTASEQDKLFTVLQDCLLRRIAQLEQRLALNQEALLACELVIRNKRELIIGVDRSLSVTVAAFEAAKTLRAELKAMQADSGQLQQLQDAANYPAIPVLDKFAAAQKALEELASFRAGVYAQMSLAVVDIKAVSEKITASLKQEKAAWQVETDAEGEALIRLPV